MSSAADAIGDFQNLFAQRQDDYQRLTGIRGFGGFQTASYNPYFIPKVEPAKESIQARAGARATKINALFANNAWPPLSYDRPKATLSVAMNDLATEIKNQLGTDCMFSGEGYLAYEIRDKYGNSSYSTNLTRLRKLFMRGEAAIMGDEGPMIRGANGKGFPTNASMALGTNRVWAVIIAWHKLVNASNIYSPTYRARGWDANFARLASKKVQNLSNKLYYLAKNPGKFQDYQTKIQNTIAKTTARYNTRLDIIKQIVGGLNPLAGAGAEMANQGGAQQAAIVGNMAGGVEE